mmetsp:Transcript_30072/g.72619  ORF Transcript_30072/g.72619 Transcript_30072/m.72619 type:complete len:530 (+) Transcript_30072:77-1666(+)
MNPSRPEYRILALYRFVPIVASNNSFTVSDVSGEGITWDEATLMAHPERHPTLRTLQLELLSTLRGYDVKGTLLIAPEGINGTICYPFPPPTIKAAEDSPRERDEDPVANYLKNHPLFGGTHLRTRLSVWKEEENGQQAFHRLKIKIKAEIVTLGLGRPLIDRKPVDCVHHEDKSHEREERIELMDQTIENKASQSSSIASTIISASNGLSQRHISNKLANPLATKGHYLSPTQWDEACRNPDILVIDTRNTYEIEIGTFESAVDPKTQNFSDFPGYLEKLAGEYDWSGYDGKKEAKNNSNKADSSNGNSINGKKPPPQGIAMFCTGGIRCEKATSYAIQSSLFPKELPIYHLDGGILAYLDDVAKREKGGDGSNGEQQENDAQSRQNRSSKTIFHGECFVFDKRVAVAEGLKPSSNYISCHGCRGPMNRRLLLPFNDAGIGTSTNFGVTDQREEAERYKALAQGIRNLPQLRYDSSSKRHYLPGLTCPRCHASATRESLERFAQRGRQMEICAREGKSHFQDQGVQER